MNFIKKWFDKDAVRIPVISTSLDFADNIGTIKARLTFGRMNYKVEPGIYAVGNPNSDSIVLVSANYKMSFDVLRSNLDGINAWILVLDTKGINVWCAAGKGTFSTKEIVDRIKITGLEKIVNHRKLIVPQLGAPGVSAYEVKKLSGFSVTYGPVRASDIKAFIENGMKAAPEMRQVNFGIYDRFVLVPAEIILGWKQLFFVSLFMFVISGINKNGYSFDLLLNKGTDSIYVLLLIYFSGVIIGPLLLPWLPGRSFSMKGFFAGMIGFMVSFYYGLLEPGILEIAAWLLMFTSLSSYMTLNFTGASTYTSLSGVKKEMKLAIPLQIIGAIMGFGILIVSRFMF